jgi:hypothetical protein
MKNLKSLAILYLILSLINVDAEIPQTHMFASHLFTGSFICGGGDALVFNTDVSHPSKCVADNNRTFMDDVNIQDSTNNFVIDEVYNSGKEQINRYAEELNSPTNFNVFGYYNRIALEDKIKVYDEESSVSYVKSLQAQNNSSITINFPAVNDNWAVDSFHNITWTSPNEDSVDISVSYDSGLNWIMLDSNRSSMALDVNGINVNKFLWKVPNNVGVNRIIRINYSSSNLYMELRSFNIIPSQEDTCYSWQCLLNGASDACLQQSDNVPVWRDGAQLKTFTSSSTRLTKMYLLGGWNPADPAPENPSDLSRAFNFSRSNEVWSTDDGISWQKEKAYTPVTYPNTTLMWEERHVFNHYVYNDKIWIIGGDINSGHYQNDVWNTSDVINWSYVANLPSTPFSVANLRNRVLSLYNNFASKMWVMGGQTLPDAAPFDGIGDNPPFAIYNDVYSTTDGINWTRHNDAPWSARGVYSGNVVLGGKMWVLGGGVYDVNFANTLFYNDVWSTADGDNWVQSVDYAPWFSRQFHNVVVFDDKMWVIAGVNRNATSFVESSSGNLNDVWYSSDGVNWYQLPNTPWPHRHGSSVEVLNDELYLMAGNNIPAYDLSLGYCAIDVYKLTKTVCQPTIGTVGTASFANATSIKKNTNIIVYPNPTTNFLHIKSNSQSLKGNNFILTDVIGREIMRKSFNHDFDNTIELGHLPNGVYFIEINRIANAPILKQKLLVNN